jgi:hypothetical protein
MNDIPETTQFDVNLPKPRTRKVLIGVLVAVLVLGAIGVAAAAIVNRTAQSPGDATTAVMPAETMLYFALNTRADQLPNFNVIADAWQDSKEAKMLASGLELAFTQAGLNWEEDVQPWLGDRVALGIVDLGGVEQTQADEPQYRVPSLVIAAQTEDRARSDAALASVFEQIVKDTGGSIETETYRGIPITYVKSGNDFMPETGAYATVNDLVVLTLNKEGMHMALNAALDGRNLSASENFNTVMSALPDQTAGAFYMDYGRFMPAYLEMFTGISTRMPIYVPCEFATSGLSPTPDADCVKQRQEAEQQRAEQQRRVEEQMQQMREMMQAMGGTGATMTYEPTGIRFDTAMQYDPAKLPPDQRQRYEAALSPASGRVFASLPASAILAVDFSLKGGLLRQMLNPDALAAQFATLGMTTEDFAAELNQAQQLIGVDLQTDLIDLMDGDASLAILARDQQRSDALSVFSVPIEFALLIDSSDADKLMGSVAKVLQGLSLLSGERGFTTQSLSGLPYSVVTAEGTPLFTYGVVDGRLVIGTDSDTLLAIDNAEQAPLSADALFKQASGLLPGNRLNTFFMNFAPLWKLAEERSLGEECQACNYLKHFAWLSAGNEIPADGLARGSLHIGIAK